MSTESKPPSSGAAAPVDEQGFPADPLAGLNQKQRIEQFLLGSINLAQLQNISHEELYEFANVGMNFYKLGQFKKALPIFEGVVALEPTEAWFHLCLGLCFAQTGDDYRAILEPDRSIFLNESMTQSRVERAEILMKHGELDLAITDLAKAVELDPSGKDPYAMRARVLLDSLRQIVDSKGTAKNGN